MAADRARSAAANFRISDFPPGWTSTPASTDTSGPGIQQGLAPCLHVGPGFLAGSDPAEVDSALFVDPTGGSQASSSVDYEASQAVMGRAFAVLEEPQLAACLQSAINTQVQYQIAHPISPNDTLPPGVLIGAATVAQVHFAPVGDESVGYQMTVPLSFGGYQLDFYGDFIAVRKGRAAAMLSYFGIGAPFDSVMEQQLTAATANRLNAPTGA